ncbi:LacI family DNA-binding transcriptional regulator [Ameyamaea chiangmaiensis]|uniref:LacI family DNA-binding transcriptional regulator n=1 Tax=Ameyamaea chiangmaiensis TaxID=442969 RepID=A0A850PFD5_9PROT|nr:LacI family DNA-binding transcriptional regulator [Ameyamaea chiangmaiensis]MBS4074008.1 LacI family DNA-binding transcriptional regulator [Ameyamaea chiangmaiensis]NVN40956.1 LacI family DNA-binding transcriptional regulator [Ameyamaea chiangmaiensis]
MSTAVKTNKKKTGRAAGDTGVQTSVSPAPTRTRNRPVDTRPTIRDVSALAGVSRMTVSRFLRSPEVVQEETRQIVARAIDELGYVPDRAAGALSTRRSGFVGLIVPTITNTNFAQAARGLTDMLRRDGFEVLIGYTDYDDAVFLRHVKAMLARRAEALVLPSGPRPVSLQRLLNRETIPLVEIAGLPTRPLDRVVGYSNRAAGRLAAEYLIGLGYTRIGAIGAAGEGTARDHRGGRRIDGFRDALLEAGLSDEWVLRQGDPPVSFTHGARTMGNLLDRAPGLEAVFAVSDLVGVGAMMECRRRGIDIPRDLSLIGFGSFEIGREVVPSLTTVGVDYRAMGERAGRMLLDVLGGRGETDRVVDVGMQLVVRETTTAARRPATTRDVTVAETAP